MEAGVQSSAKYVASAATALSAAACLLGAPACGRWGYGARPERLEPEPGAATAATVDPTNELRSPLLDAGDLTLDDRATFAGDGWTRPPRSLSQGIDASTDASAIFDAGPPQSASCAELPRLAAAPALDGQLEPGLATQPVTPVHWTGTGNIPAGNSLSFAAAWHAQGLYFFLQVLDPDRSPAPSSSEVWEGDGVEVYVDHDAVFAAPGSYDDPGTRQLIFAAPADDAQNGDRADAYVATTGRIAGLPSSDWIAVPTETGYVLELDVRASTLGLADWALAAGSQLAFDLAHNVSAPPGEAGVQGTRAGQYFLRVGTETEAAFYPFQNSAVFCTPTLLP